MLSETLETGLQQYRIGQKVRALRLQKNLNLAGLGDHTGLSAGMLSKIERGQLHPTLPTLLRIALVFGVGLDHFFTTAEEPAVAVIRQKDRLRLPHPPGTSTPSYMFESLDYAANNRKMAAYLADFSDSKFVESHEHDGDEFIYVIEGSLAVIVADEETVLEAGDSMYFDANLGHSYRRVGDAPCRVIVVTAPP